MAQVTSTQITPINSGKFDVYGGGVTPRQRVKRFISVSGVTAGDTIAAAVLGFALILGVDGGGQYNDTTSCSIAVDFTNNQLVVGAGPANQTVTMCVEGAPATTY